MQRIKRLFASLLTAAVMLALQPVTVLAADNVHEIDSAVGLQSALETISSGDIIRLAADIEYPYGITIDGLDITFDLDSHNLNITSESGTALSVSNGGTVLLSREGKLNVSGNGYGVRVIGGGRATVTNAAANGAGSNAACALDGEITVRENVTADGMNSIGAYATGSNSFVVVGGNATASKGFNQGVYAENGGTITVGGNASVNGECGYCIYATGSGSVTVEGNAAAGKNNCQGARAESGGMVTVNGDVVIDGMYSYGAFAVNSTITMNGSITVNSVNSYGVAVESNGIITVNGDITANKSNDYGVHISSGGTVTIEGIITATIYISLNNVNKSPSSGVRGSSPYEDYFIYSHGSNIVRARIHPKIAIKTTVLPDAVEGISYSKKVEVDYVGTGTVTFSATGLPSGLTVNTGTGVVSGKPDAGTKLGSPYSVTVNATDGMMSDSSDFLLIVNAAAAMPVINTQPAAATRIIGQTANFTVAATASDGGTLSYRWQRSTNGGATWNNITGLGTTSASYTTGTLALTNNANQYRCTVTNTKNGTTAVINSNAAVLTVKSHANNAPTSRNPIPAQRVAENDTISFNASDIAQDADDDTLIITDIVTEPASVTATASLHSGTVTITGVLGGSTSVIVRVSDGTDAVNITVPITVTSFPPDISPASVSYDLANPADISTIIIWNSARSVTDIVYSFDHLTTPDAFEVSGNSLTIKADYLSGLGLCEADTAEFDITFDTGYTAKLTVNIVNNYIPGKDATLRDLTVGSNTVSGFVSGTDTYTVELASGTQPGDIAAIVGATPSDPKATMKIQQTDSLPGSATVEVIAEDTITTKTYTVYFTLGTTPNIAPSRRAGVPAAVTAIVTVHNAYTIDLSTIFEDVDADQLTYKVSMNGAAYLETAASYSYTPTSAGDTLLVFKANDDTADSTDTFTVLLMADTAPPKTYDLTITADTGGSIITGTNGNYAEGTVIMIAATPFGNYSFSQWTATGGGTFSSTDSAATTFTMPANSVAITAKFTYDGRSRTPLTPAPAYYADVSWNGAATTLPITVNTGLNSAIVNFSNQQDDLVMKAETAVITVPFIPGTISYILGIPVDYLADSDGEGTLTFVTHAGSVTLPTNMLADLAGADGKKAKIIIGQGDKSDLTEVVHAAIGNRPLIQLVADLGGKKINWSNPDTPVTVSIPYAPTEVELANPESIIVWYIDGSGNAVPVPDGRYDPDTGTVTFTTTHFSYYAITYAHRTFGDLNAVEWARKPVEVLASKGILKGVSENAYAPLENITRADFLCFLVRSLGMDAKADDNFEDIRSDAYYSKEIGIAKKLGITSGTGNNQFSPDASITRQDMMVMAGNALRITKKLEGKGAAYDLDGFADKSIISVYAVDRVASVVRAGLIVGSGDKLNPLGSTTRAEAAAFLYRIYNK